MPYRPTKPTLRKLVALAQSQAGYLGAKQAAEIERTTTDCSSTAGDCVVSSGSQLRLQVT